MIDGPLTATYHPTGDRPTPPPTAAPGTVPTPPKNAPTAAPIPAPPPTQPTNSVQGKSSSARPSSSSSSTPPSLSLRFFEMSSSLERDFAASRTDQDPFAFPE
ncbi:hypothetical protein E1264_33155 [Actinomadura sp. KC216]|nr:hypothetical protein E1264_33155 [Actinomadura sp. KC216]